MRLLFALALLAALALPAAAAQDSFGGQGIPCTASCQVQGRTANIANKGCVKEACNNPFGCQRVRYIWIGDYLRDRAVINFNDQNTYFLDTSGSALAAIKAKRAEIAADLKKFKKDEIAAQARLANLRAGGCSVASVAAMRKAYDKYDSMLVSWRKLILKNNKNASGASGAPRLTLNASNTSQSSGNPARAAQAAPAKMPLNIDRLDKEFTAELLDVYELCGFGGIMARQFFGNLSMHELKPGEKFPPK